MSHYIEKVTVSLENLISELARNPSLFLKNPDTDFSRNRKINFKTCVGITMNSGGCTLNKELLDFFDFDVNAPTVSAYTQQRAKILPEAFEYLFHAFTEENAQTKNLYEGYQLLACDGSNLTIAPNLNDPETLWKSNQLGATGNHLHLNALYDVLNRTYIDALVQTASTYQEHRACIQMIERVTLDKVILIADRGYENYNIMSHAIEKGWKFLIRIKDVHSNGIASGLELPQDVCRLLNWERNEVPLNIGGYKFDKKTKTFPIFINYDKQDDISDTTKYEDHFVGYNRLIAISKSGRTLDSEDVQNFLHAKERGIDVQLFVRKNKDDKISKEFYYLGRVNATGQVKEFVMPNTDKTAVEIEWVLDTPVREDIYEYIVNG